MSEDNTTLGSISAKVWREHEPVPSAEEIQDAEARMKASFAWVPSVIASYIQGILHVEYTSGVPTLAVTLLPDGFAAQLVNPSFAMSLKSDRDLAFVRTHEMYHLILRHLWGEREKNETLRMAQEAIINDRVQSLFDPSLAPKNRRMPVQVDDAGNEEETGVNPYKVWNRYRKDLKDQGLSPVEYAEFYSSDLRCYAEMLKMTKNPVPRNQKSCETSKNLDGQGEQQSQSGNGQGETPHVDDQSMKDVVNESLQNSIKKAVEDTSSDNKAKKELTSLMDTTDGDEQAQKVWGSLGAGALRGETLATQRVEFWKQWLQDNLFTRLVEGSRLVYNQKIWWEPTVKRKGDEESRKVLVAVDASGSMQTSVLEYIVTLLGDEDGLEMQFVAFDTEVYPFELGDPLRGGGGTDVRDISRYIEEEMSGNLDAVVCVTDGYFPPAKPEYEPDKWVFLVTPGGTTEWMDDLGLSVYELDVPGM